MNLLFQYYDASLGNNSSAITSAFNHLTRTGSLTASFLGSGNVGDIYVYNGKITQNGKDIILGDAFARMSDLSGYTFDPPLGPQVTGIMNVVNVASQVSVGYSSATVQIPFERALFHELAHAVVRQNTALDWKFHAPDGGSINMDESIAVMSENLFYVSNPTDYRFGHIEPDTSLSIVKGKTGLEMFSGQATPTVSVYADHVDFTSNNGNGAYYIIKTFYEVGYVVGLNQYANYVLDRIAYSDPAGLVQVTAGKSGITSAASGMIGNIMAPGQPATAITQALTAMDSMHVLSPGLYIHTFGQLIGIDRNQIFDSEISDDPAIRGKGIDITGPVGTNDTHTSHELAIQVGGNSGAIVIGASGFIAGNSAFNGVAITPDAHDATHSVDSLVGGSQSDMLIAGTGYSLGEKNALYGMSGDDVLAGGTADDLLDGGANNDILLSSDGNDELVGGGDFDTAYYGNQLVGITYSASGVVKAHGTDVLMDIKQVVGTSKVDTFHAAGTGMTFIGNGGNDRFYAADGADTFVGKYASGLGIVNSLDFGSLTAGVDLHMSDPTKIGKGITIAGHEFSGITNITGSTHPDNFEVSAATDRVTLHGGDDADTFILSGCVSAYGDGGDDYFSIGSQWYGQIIVDGGTGSNTLDLTNMRTDYPGGGSVKIQINLAAHTVGAYNSNVGGTLQTMNYSNIDTFVLGTQVTDIAGTSGIDQIRSGTGGGTIHGNAGGDILYGSVPFSASRVINLYGDAGDDTFFLDGAANAYGGADNDHIFGSSQRDIITGEAGNDEIRAGDGYDLIMGMVGTDTVDGGDRIDLFRVSAAGDTSATTFSFALGGVDGPAFHVVTGADSVTLTNVEHIYFDKPNSYVADFNFDIGEAIAAMTADGVTSMTGDVLEASLKAHHYATRAYWQQPLEDAHRGAAATNSFDGSADEASADPLLDAYDWNAYFGNGSTHVSDQPADQMFLVHDDRSLVGSDLDQYFASPFIADGPSFHAESARGAALLAQTIAFEGGAGVGDLGFHGQDADPMGFLAAHLMTPIHQDMLIL